MNAGRNFDDEYFPNADSLVEYLAHFAAESDLNIKYSTAVDKVSRSGKSFTLSHGSESTQCEYVVVAAGVSVPYKPNADKEGLIEYYDDMSVNKTDYEGQDVLIIGRGNAALETANHIYGRTARVNLISTTRVKLSWETHYVGHVRGINNEIMDSYMLKSMDILGGEHDAQKMMFTRQYHPSCRPKRGDCSHPDGRGLIHVFVQDEDGEWEEDTHLGPVDRVLACAGWVFDDSLFETEIKPQMWTRRFPAMSPAFESPNVPGLYFAGTLMHARDHLRSSGGFIHGFRYLTRALYRQFEFHHHNVAWPSVAIQSEVAPLTTAILRRVNEMDGPYQMFGVLLEVVVLPSGNKGDAQYFEEVPADFLPAFFKDGGKEGGGWLSGGKKKPHYLTISLEYGRGFSGAGHDTFSPDALKPPNWESPNGPGVDSNFLHPIIRYHVPKGKKAKPGVSEDELHHARVELVAKRQRRKEFEGAVPGLLRKHLAKYSAEKLADLATEIGVSDEEYACPPELELGRSVCFSSDVRDTYHMHEDAKLEWTDDEHDIQPLAAFVAIVLNQPPLGMAELSEISKVMHTDDFFGNDCSAKWPGMT